VLGFGGGGGPWGGLVLVLVTLLWASLPTSRPASAGSRLPPRAAGGAAALAPSRFGGVQAVVEAAEVPLQLLARLLPGGRRDGPQGLQAADESPTLPQEGVDKAIPASKRSGPPRGDAIETT